MSHPTPARTAAKFAEPSDSRCTKCEWVHETDTTARKSFRGVELCALHAAAPELLKALTEMLQQVKRFGLWGLNPAGKPTVQANTDSLACVIHAKAALAYAVGHPGGQGA